MYICNIYISIKYKNFCFILFLGSLPVTGDHTVLGIKPEAPTYKHTATLLATYPYPNLTLYTQMKSHEASDALITWPLKLTGFYKIKNSSAVGVQWELCQGLSMSPQPTVTGHLYPAGPGKREQ